MTIKENVCPDCGVPPGAVHDENCDVARCTTCGMQRLMCVALERGHDDGGGHVWTGEWPGDVEVREGLAEDLNDLADKGLTGKLRSDGQRWQRP